MKKENHYWGSEKAFDLVMEVMDSGRATSVESSKQELEGALGFRADILDRESRTNGGGRKDIWAAWRPGALLFPKKRISFPETGRSARNP